MTDLSLVSREDPLSRSDVQSCHVSFALACLTTIGQFRITKPTQTSVAAYRGDPTRIAAVDYPAFLARLFAQIEIPSWVLACAGSQGIAEADRLGLPLARRALN